MKNSLCAILILCGVALLAPLYSQQVTGSILGNVLDAQNAVVADTKVEARNLETGLTRSVQSNERGEYRLDFLPPGNYEVEVARTGFRTFKQTGVVLQVGQFARVDVRLQVGDSTATITIESAAPLVNTTDSTVGQTVNEEQITTLPLVNRSVYSLLSLTPGVQQTGNAIALGFRRSAPSSMVARTPRWARSITTSTAGRMFPRCATRVIRRPIRTRWKSFAWRRITTARSTGASATA